MTTISTYEQQANDFLTSTGTTLTTTFKEYGSMPYDKDENESRDIYICVLKNSHHRYRFTFGQSTYNTRLRITAAGLNADTKPFEPSAYDILACLTKSDPSTFENFCSEYGYDSDSRSAYKTYKAVMKEYHNLVKLFTPEQMELLQEIQ